MEMIPVDKLCYTAFLDKAKKEYELWLKGIRDLENTFYEYLDYETLPVYEINLMASKLEELRAQKKQIENILEKLRLEASN